MTAAAPARHMTSHILERCLQPEGQHIPLESARWILENVRLAEQDKTRIQELYDLHMDEKISPAEFQELENYSKIIAMIDILRAKAKSAVRKSTN